MCTALPNTVRRKSSREQQVVQRTKEKVKRTQAKTLERGFGGVKKKNPQTKVKQGEIERTKRQRRSKAKLLEVPEGL